MMQQQRHIINKQILEVEVPNKEAADAIQADVLRLYQEKLIPIINALCDQHSVAGTTCKIEKLDIDLGNLALEEFESSFAQKFAEAIATQTVEVLSDTMPETGTAQGGKTPLAVLSYYLFTGTLPWWASLSTKSELQALFDKLVEAPAPAFKALMRQVGQQKTYRDRMVHTFSESQVKSAIAALTTFSPDQLFAAKQEIARVLGRQAAPSSANHTAEKIGKVFWSAVLSHVATTTHHADLLAHARAQTLRTFFTESSPAFQKIRQEISGSHPAATAEKWEDTLHQQARSIQQQHRSNPTLQAFHRQLSQLLQHPLLFRLTPHELQKLSTLLATLLRTQKHADTQDAVALRVVTETNLGPVSRHLHRLETQFRQMETPPATPNMATLPTKFDETDTIAVGNAGLVIFWPFLQRFFTKLGLVNKREFDSAAARHKAVCVLQYLAEEAEEEIFEGLLALNKILCGIPLSDSVAVEPLSADEKEIADGLLQAVIAQGPYWKNLSLSGLRTSYLQREGLLRSRDGHWLLQVKKETHDITLEKLPWSFSTVKLPWMNEILIIEWN